MKTLILAAVLSLISTCTFASCDGLGGSSDSLAMGIDECEGTIYFYYLQKEKSQPQAVVHTYQFKDECEYAKTGFTCRVDGHTPFAGTTWERYTGSNFKNGKPKCEPVFFVCTKGCQSTAIPKELSGVYEVSEEGECE